jgi:2-polyprenyl-6-hydroxyphenyl methylase/3-demethylubiquinone-9 3-methyltransferase
MDRRVLDDCEPEEAGASDEDQIAFFNACAAAQEGSDEDRWQEKGRAWLYKYNPVRVAFLHRMARRGSSLDGLRVLDVGCGTGVFCEALAEDGAIVTGVDLANNAVLFAARRAKELRLPIRYEVCAASSMNERFDAVTVMEVIEHVPDYAAFLRECASRVKPGGILVVSTINRTWKSWLYAILIAERVLNLLPRGAHDWKRFVTPAEIETVLRQLEFGDVTMTGVTTNIRTGLLQLAPDRAVNFMIAARRPG